MNATAILRHLGGAACLAALTAFRLPAAESPGLVTGRVTDATTRSALAGATVTARGGTAAATTERDGSFALGPLAPGTHPLVVAYVGLPDKTVVVTLAPGRGAEVAVALGDDAVQLEAFRVTGLIDGQARALNQQRGAANVMNIVSSDAFGEFPDASVADAARRLPGITIEREAGNPEGRYVTIRGLNAEFNAVSIDGQRLTVSNFDGASRSVPLDVISARSADAIEVAKTLTPDRDADGIGGAINIRTRNAFDRDGRFATAEAAYSRNSLVASYRQSPFGAGVRFSAAQGDFLGAGRRWGYLVSLDYRHTPFATSQAGTTGWWDPDRRDPGDGTFPDRVTFNGTGYFIPRGFLLQEFFDDVRGGGLTFNLEHRPDAGHKLRLNASYSVRDSNRGRQRQIIDYRFGTSRIDTSAAAALPVRIDGDTFGQFTTTASSRLERQVRDFYEEQTVLNLAVTGEHRLGATTLTWSAGRNRGEFDGSAAKDVSATFRWGDNLGEFRSSRNTWSVPAGQGYEARFTTSNDRLTPSNYVFSSLDRGTRRTVDGETALALNVQRPLALAGADRANVKAGVKARFRGRALDDRQNFFTGLAGGARWFGDRVLDGTGAQIFGAVTAPWSVGSTAGGRHSFGYLMDPAAVRAAADTLLARGLLARSTDNAARSLVNSYSADEDVHSAYAQVQGAWGRLGALAGVRLERTETEFRTHSGNSTSGNILNPVPVKGGNSYLDVNPGVNLRYDAGRQLVFRAAVTRTLARASYTQLNPVSVLNTTTSEDSSLPTLTLGDPRLRPVRSVNYDLTAEYYLPSVGLISGGAFLKEMRNNIYRLNDIIVLPPYGSVQRRQWRNADGARVRGFELAFERRLDFLPGPLAGLGVSANYTRVGSEVRTGRPERAGRRTPLFAQVPETYNAGLTYARGPLQARLAWNARSAYLLFNGLDGNPKLDRHLDDHGQLDLTASWRLGRGFTLYVEGINLTNRAERAYDGDPARRLDYLEYRGWSGNFGVRWRL
ncbi:MAG: TonB-dependent receptor [Verrucomicrobiota bacterium]